MEVRENLFQYLNMFEQEELMDFDLNHMKLMKMRIVNNLVLNKYLSPLWKTCFLLL
jgi:hypothetical protein